MQQCIVEKGKNGRFYGYCTGDRGNALFSNGNGSVIYGNVSVILPVIRKCFAVENFSITFKAVESAPLLYKYDRAKHFVWKVKSA